MAVSKKNFKAGKYGGNKQTDAEYLDLLTNALFSGEKGEIKLAAQKSKHGIKVTAFWRG